MQFWQSIPKPNKSALHAYYFQLIPLLFMYIKSNYITHKHSYIVVVWEWFYTVCLNGMEKMSYSLNESTSTQVCSSMILCIHSTDYFLLSPDHTGWPKCLVWSISVWIKDICSRTQFHDLQEYTTPLRRINFWSL